MEKTPEADLLHEMIGFAAQWLMEPELEGATRAAYGEKSSERLAERKGYRDRLWEIRASSQRAGNRQRWPCTGRWLKPQPPILSRQSHADAPLA